MKQIVKDVDILTNRELFSNEFMNDNKVLFRRNNRELDRMGEPIDGYDRVDTGRYVAIKLFREIKREIEKYVWENKPRYIYFTAW